MVTKHGVIKKTKLDQFANVRRNGLIAINLDEGDELLAVDLSDGSRDIILGSAQRHGRALQREGRAPDGTRRARRQGDDAREGRHVVAMDVDRRRAPRSAARHSLAFGKRTPIDDYRHTSRGGKGVKAFARQRDDIGQVVDQILVAPDDQILMITSGNQVIRLKVGEIRKTGRDAKGVRLQRLGEGDEVIAITNLGKQAKQITEITGEPQQNRAIGECSLEGPSMSALPDVTQSNFDSRGAEEPAAGARRLLGAVVRAVPNARAGCREGRGRALPARRSSSS